MRGISIILIAMIVSLSLFAADAVGPGNGGAYSFLTSPPGVLSARSKAMGGVSVLSVSSADAVFNNPAGLASGRTEVSLPYLEITLYNVTNMLKSGLISSAMKLDMETLLSDAMNFLDTLGVRNKFFRLDAGVSFSVKGFGFGVSIQDTLYTYASSGNYLSTQLLDELNALAVIGFGHRFSLPGGKWSIDAGVSVAFSYLAYNDASSLSASSILNGLNGDDFDPLSYFSNTPIMAGWSIPINLSVNINMPFHLSLGIAARNMNGTYRMNAYDGYEKVIKSPFGKDNEFKFSTDFSLDAGIAWKIEGSKFLNSSLEVDYIDILSLPTSGNYDMREIFSHLRMGAEFDLFRTIDLRAGLGEGYISFGVSLDIWILRIEASYFREELGETIGSKGVDGFTIRINLGYDRKKG